MEPQAGADESIAKKDNNWWKKFTATDAVLKKWRFEEIMRKEYEAKNKRFMDEYMDENKKTQAEASDEITEPRAEASETFGDTDSHAKISASHLRLGVVSIALYNEKVMVYACSGAAVRHWHDNIRGHHRIFVTTARLAHKFNENRTSDDNLRIELRTQDNATLHGFLGLYDENIAMVTSFSLKCVYTMDTCNHVDLPKGTRNSKQLFAIGYATNGTLMGAKCSHPVFSATGLVSANCKITEIGLGGPVIYFGRGGSGHIAGLITGYCKEKTTFLPTKMLHESLQRLLLLTSKTSHFHGYSLPDGVKTVIPSGCVVRSKILQSLGYPLPPPLVFELNGRLAGRFEEYFGQFHYWDGYPFDFPYRYEGEELIWKQFRKDVLEKISQSVVSIASFHIHGKRKIRYFACTGLLIKGPDCTFVLTSASLVRTGDDGQIYGNLSIEVFLPPNHRAEGTLEFYHLNYNIAIVRLQYGLSTPISPVDIFSGSESRNTKVVAIGRAPKGAHGLLMASMGKVKGKYNAVTQRKNKHLAARQQSLDLDCEDLLLSTCQIKKAGIGGPLIRLDGCFVGMNFYDESQTTPFLPRKEILKVWSKASDLIGRAHTEGPFDLECLETSKMPSRIMTRSLTLSLKRKRNQWPVSKPYWCLGGQVGLLDQLRGKILM
ncbi:uncharacterized protein [Lolium perenne]|uniref:uncharacterized protein isoform X2 n=1 Tax=Lolium perenne TaxID=4522 RepID=UPI0021F626B8|nr:uncharacterized protein LOC127298781 isoform X2 [Lolium perenne]